MIHEENVIQIIVDNKIKYLSEDNVFGRIYFSYEDNINFATRYEKNNAESTAYALGRGNDLQINTIQI